MPETEQLKINIQLIQLRYNRLSRENEALETLNNKLQSENRILLSENEKLREIFRFAQIEFDKRNKRIEELEAELVLANNRIKELTEENSALKLKGQEMEAKCNLLNKLAFGRKSEQKQKPETKVSVKNRGARQGHKGYGRKIPEGLPVMVETIDLPDDEKVCKNCHKEYEDIGTEEVSTEVCVEKIYYLKRTERKKYKKTCNCPGEIIITAPSPIKLIPKGKFSKEFWVDVLINKYKYHLPIERQVEEMKNFGLCVSSGSIFGGLNKLYSLYLEPLYEAMIKSIRDAEHLHADETGWKIFIKIDKKGNYKWYLWVFISKDVVLFVLDSSRGAKVPLQVLFDIKSEEIEDMGKERVEAVNKKIMNVDKYSSYKRLENLGLVVLAYCWAHQRREFIEAKVRYPEITSWSDGWTEKIGTLYHNNNERIKYNIDDIHFQENDTKLKEMLDEISLKIKQEYTHPGQIAIMDSMTNHWRGLTIFADNPQIPMDNNISENMLRDPVLGRKNYYGNHSVWGGKLGCCMFSLIKTCEKNNILPRDYLLYYFDECLKRGKPPDNIELFLPHKLNEETKNRIRGSPLFIKDKLKNIVEKIRID